MRGTGQCPCCGTHTSRWLRPAGYHPGGPSQEAPVPLSEESVPGSLSCLIKVFRGGNEGILKSVRGYTSGFLPRNASHSRPVISLTVVKTSACCALSFSSDCFDVTLNSWAICTGLNSFKAAVQLPVVAGNASSQHGCMGCKCRGDPGGILFKVENTHACHPLMEMCNHPRVFTVEICKALYDFACSITE
jgi:hypothetical protein